jgi:hypothetical protein
MGGGSRPAGKAPNKKRDFEQAYKRLLEQYFRGPDSIYNEGDFERRFWMPPRAIFNKISDAIFGEVPFTLHKNRAGKAGIHPLVCLVACLRLLAYDTAADSVDENLEMLETVASHALKEFARLMVQKFGAQYLTGVPPLRRKKEIWAL